MTNNRLVALAYMAEEQFKPSSRLETKTPARVRRPAGEVGSEDSRSHDASNTTDLCRVTTASRISRYTDDAWLVAGWGT